ncbi:MAG: type 4b pilus protein PilO2 [Alphaproteobacteria bacterium]|nr:type 4b pilus protein PilO2 [Alphaproteobacteria bacterium]
MAENQTDEKAWKASFTEGGTTYAASLFWQPLLDEDKPLPEIKEAAENILEGADLYVTRQGKSSQFGLAASSQGFTRGMPSAAVSLITGLGNVTSFLGVFKVDTGWWYVCFRNDVILSDGDTLFADEKDAKNQFISMLVVPDWDALFAPAEWGIEETRDTDLGTLLKKGLQAKLDKINTSNDNLMLLIIIIGFAVILWFAYSALQSMFFSPPEQPVVAPVEQIEQPVALPPEPKPWESLENPVEIVQNCYKTMNQVATVVTPGWKLEGLSCDTKNGVVTSWKRELGRLTWIEQALDVSGVDFSSRVLDRSGNTVMVSVPIGEISTLNSPPEYNENDLVDIMNDLNQALGISINYQQSTTTSQRGSVYRSLSFTISSTTSPLTWLELLTRFSGLYINIVKYDINTGNWSFEGGIYEL